MERARALIALLIFASILALSSPIVRAETTTNATAIGDWSQMSSSGSDTNLYAWTIAHVKFAYYEWDLSPYKSSNVTNATFCTYAQAGFFQGLSYVTNSTTEYWDENSPPVISDGWNLGYDVVNQTTSNTGGYICFDVTKFIKNYAFFNRTYGTIVQRAVYSGSASRFFSKENSVNKPYLEITSNATNGTSTAPNGFTHWTQYSVCTNSSFNNGENVSCTTQGFWSPANCQDYTVTVFANATTNGYCDGQWKSLYVKEPYPDDVSTHQVSQMVQTGCGQALFNTTLYNTLVDPTDLVKAWGECQPYSNQTCSLLVNVTASCNVPNPSFTWQFPDEFQFEMNYGEAVNLANQLIMSDTGDEMCYDVDLAISDGTFARLANGNDIQSVINTLNGATNLPTHYYFDLCAGQAYPFMAYFDPQNFGYGGTVPDPSVLIYVTATVNGTVWATKVYNVNVTGTFIPIGECNYNGVCELGESHDFCPQDCPNEGQTGIVPCTTGNCTATQGNSNFLNTWWDNLFDSVPTTWRIISGFALIGISVCAVAYYVGRSVPAVVYEILALVELGALTMVSWLPTYIGILMIILIGMITAYTVTKGQGGG